MGVWITFTCQQSFAIPPVEVDGCVKFSLSGNRLSADISILPTNHYPQTNFRNSNDICTAEIDLIILFNFK